MSKKVTRTAAGLTDAMLDELDALNAGSSTPQMARAKSAVVNTAISAARLSMDFARFVPEERANDLDNKVLQSFPLGESPAAA